MVKDSISTSQRAAARVIGFVYLPTFLVVAAANFGALLPLVHAADRAGLGPNVLTHETQFRIGILGMAAYCIGTLAIVAAMYIVQRPAGRTLALFAALCRSVHALTWALVTLNLFAALRLFRAAEGGGPASDAMSGLGGLHVSGFDQYYLGLLFWSIAALASGILWLKSRQMPRLLAIAGIVASTWCAACTVALIIEPAIQEKVNLWLFDSPMVLFEIAVSLLLLIRGLPVAGKGGGGAAEG